MKIALIGFFKETYGDAPWQDNSWEKWGMPWDRTTIHAKEDKTEKLFDPGWEKYDVLFEMHEKAILDIMMGNVLEEKIDKEGKLHRVYYRTQNYIQLLRKCAKSKKHTLYMQDMSFIKGATKYPIEKTDKMCGHYYVSSLAYMLALAILKIKQNMRTHPTHDKAIGLWGINLKGEGEWGYQRANIEYLLGMAKAWGIELHIAQHADVLCFNEGQQAPFGATNIIYVDRYGIMKKPQQFTRTTIGMDVSVNHGINMTPKPWSVVEPDA